MPRVRTNGIELEYEILGEGGEPLLLIMGLGAQLIHWPDELCELFVSRGFQLIRFDNRDAGQSSRVEDNGPRMPMWQMIGRSLLGLPVPAPYRIEDMADDTAGLLEAIGVDRAHVLGVSFGGMIAQMLAIRHPARVLSLTSAMSTPGGRRWSLARPRALRALLGPPPRSADEAAESLVRLFRIIGSPGFYRDEERLAELARRSFARSRDPRAVRRQLAAILASGSRYEQLRYLEVPALVFHGAEDPLILPAAARATARAIPGARLSVIPGMGHDLVEGVWPLLVDGVCELVASRSLTTA
jgi:pimeloyl-ACP methyl ester carboxylesterase